MIVGPGRAGLGIWAVGNVVRGVGCGKCCAWRERAGGRGPGRGCAGLSGSEGLVNAS